MTDYPQSTPEPQGAPEPQASRQQQGPPETQGQLPPQPAPAPGYGPPAPDQGYAQQGYVQQGSSQLSPADERTWSIAAHLSPFLASLIGLPFLGPLVIYLVFRDRGPFIRHHAAQALNFQIIVAIGLLISIPLMFVIVGFITAAVIGVAAIVFQIVAAVEANNGKWYRYPMTPDWVK
jgi:hypothetical protein